MPNKPSASAFGPALKSIVLAGAFRAPSPSMIFHRPSITSGEICRPYWTPGDRQAQADSQGSRLDRRIANLRHQDTASNAGMPVPCCSSTWVLSSRAPQTLRGSARPPFLWGSPDRGAGFDPLYFGLAKPKRKFASATRMSTD